MNKASKNDNIFLTQSWFGDCDSKLFKVKNLNVQYDV